MKTPDIRFFVIGAARCGTTSIYRMFKEHPEIYSATMKEPRFFDKNYHKGWDWYASLYKDAPAGAICGDFSPSYSVTYSDDQTSVAERISRNYPDAKIIYIVRNPISCAISNWRMTADVSGEIIPFKDAFEGAWAYSVYHRACFYRQITIFRRFFPDENILVVPLEAMWEDVEKWRWKIFDHLGVSQYDCDFPRANASYRKPNRPTIPDIPFEHRKEFVNLVKQDAEEILRYTGVPIDFWDISIKSRAWGRRMKKPERIKMFRESLVTLWRRYFSRV